MARIVARGWLLALTLLLGACAETAYYWQSIEGHVRLMRSARPIRDWLDDVQTEPALRARLHTPVHDEELEAAAQRVRLHQLLDRDAVVGAGGHHDGCCGQAGDVDGDGVLGAVRATVGSALVVEGRSAV